MDKIIIKISRLLICAVMLMPFQLSASNAGFLKYAVITDFSEKDIQLLTQEYKKVLLNNKLGDVHKWQSEGTKISGEITVIKQYMQNENKCKRLKFKNHSASQSATSYFNFCEINKQWMLVN